MANPAAFIFLLMYLCSAHGTLSSGNFWIPSMPLSSHSWSAQLYGGQPLFTAACWHTQHHTTTSSVSSHCSRWHVHFKASLTMPTATFLDLSPTGAMAKSGNLTHSGQSTATSITSFSTNSGKVIFQDDFTLLVTLQERKIHAPPRPCPAPAGVCSATKTQLQANRTATKDAKARAVEDKKIVVAACKAEAVAKKRIASFPLPRPRRLRQDPR